MAFPKRLFFFLYLIFPAIAAAIAIVWLASIPSDMQNAILFGMSKSRLLVVGILAFAGVGFLFLSIQALKQPENTIDWFEKKLASYRFLILCALSSGLLFFTASIILAVPDKYLGEFWAIEERIRPLVIWLLLVSIQALAGLIGWQVRKNPEAVNTAKTVLAPGGITLGSLLIIWGIIAITRLGLTGGNSYWSRVGVPVLWPQIFLALALALGLRFLLTHLVRDQAKRILLDLVLSILIGLAAIILWNNQSYVPGVFNTQPRPPTNEIYPINDSLIFDLAAQKMLIGRPMVSDAQDKPIFIAFLAILHWLAGNSYTNFYFLQIMFYAFIPILGYFIGKNLHSHPLGIMFSILLVIREQNAIALTNYIHVSTSKMILSEMLTTLGVLLFTLLLINWLKNPVNTNPNLWLAGGVLGLTCLVRLNSIGILPATILLIGFALKFKWKPWITASILMGAFVLVTAIPWMVRNYAVSGNPVAFINNKTGGVIAKQRYNPLLEQSAPPKTEPGTPKPGTPSQSEPSKLKNYLTIGQSIATNYLHNLIGITVMLPPSFELYTVLDEIRLPYWKMDWEGSLLPGAFWIILGTLAVVSLGVASAWKRWRIAGLTPLVVILGYNITTAISLTSGGRYLVPMDWCVLFYFSIGLFDITMWILSLFGLHRNSETTQSQPDKKFQKMIPSVFIAGLAFLFLGSLPILCENLPAKRYPVFVNMDDFIEANRLIPEISEPPMAENISSLAKNSLIRVFYGRAFYPRFLGENKGDGATIEDDPLIGSTSFDHLSFFLAGGYLDTAVILPISARISPYIAGADTWVIGCQRDNYVEAKLVVFRANDIVRVYGQEPLKTSCE